MNVYVGKHPVFVSHTKEIEAMQYFTADLEHRLKLKGQDSGEQFDCLLRVRRKCADLLLKLYAEDSDIMLMDDLDSHWVRLIVRFVRDILMADQQKAG